MVDGTGWTRPHFQPGGGDAHVWFAVPGRFTGELAVSRSRHRSEGLPEGLEATLYDRASQPQRFAPYGSGPLAEALFAEEPALASATREAPHLLEVRGTVRDPATLEYLRNALGVVAAGLEQGGAAVLDVPALRAWAPEAWRREVFDAEAPQPLLHASIFVSDDEAGGTWFHTRGMRTFGRPDLSVHSVPDAHLDAVAELVRRFIAFQALGARIPEGQGVSMDGLPDGLACHHGGGLEDPDFNNVHVEVRFPGVLRADVP